MDITGEKLKDWAPYINRWHNIYVFEEEKSLCGPLTYQAPGKLPGIFKKPAALVSDQTYQAYQLPPIEATLKRFGMQYHLRHAGPGLQRIALTAIDAEKLQPLVPHLSVLTKTDTELQPMTKELLHIANALSKPVPGVLFTPNAKKALEEHRLPPTDEQGHDRFLMKDIADKVQSAEVKTLPLIDVLRLDAWERTGSRDGGPFHRANATILRDVRRELADYEKSLQAFIRNRPVAGDELHTMVTMANIIDTFANTTMNDMAFFTGETMAATGNSFPPASQGQFNLARDKIRKLAPRLRDPEFRSVIKAVPLAAWHERLSGLPRNLAAVVPEPPTALRAAPPIPKFTLIHIQSDHTIAVGTYVDSRDAESVRLAVSRRTGMAFRISESTSRPGQSKIFLATDDGRTTRKFTRQLDAEAALNNLNERLAHPRGPALG